MPNVISIRKRGCGKVMFSQACVKNSVHLGGGCPGPGPGGVCPRGVSRPRPGGVSAQTATAADGTHPTGMHSCSKLSFVGQEYFGFCRKS